VIFRPLLGAGLHQPGIDLKDDLQMAGQYALKKWHAPFFQGFGKERVVCVGKGLRDNGPGVVPALVMFIKQDAHELDHRDGRVRIVELDRHFGGEISPRVRLVAEMTPDQIAQRTGHEEILLHEPQFLAVLGLIVRV
jgi:hypothetical protein